MLVCQMTAIRSVVFLLFAACWLPLDASAMQGEPQPFLLAEAGTGKVPPSKASGEAHSSKKAAAPAKVTTVRKAAPAKQAAPKKKIVAQKSKRRPASKTKERKASEVIATDLPKPNLDLRLPADMVRKLQPASKPDQASSDDDLEPKPLLPQLFEEKEDGKSPFELNGRLLSNEMQLQLRNENRREVEGAALDFKFNQ